MAYLGEVSVLGSGSGGYLGEVSISGGIPPSVITGLTPNQVLFGAADGSIGQNANLTFNPTLESFSATGSGNKSLVSSAGNITLAGNTTFIQRNTPLNGSAATVLRVDSTTDTNQPAADVQEVDFVLSAIKTFASGPITNLRAFRITPPTYAFNSANTITNAATVAITGAPAAGVNATITNRYALWVQSGGVRILGGLDSRGAGDDASTCLLGYNASTNVFATALGASTSASGLSSIAIGWSASAGGSGALAAGRSANAGHAGAIAIGFGATTTAANQAVLGGPTSGGTGGFLSNLFLGSGVTDTTPSGCNINATGGSGNNVAGATLGLAGGRNTGNAAPGPITFSTGTVGASGSTLSSLTERARFDGLGNFLLGTTTASTASKQLVLGSTLAGVPSAPGTDLYIGGVTGGGNTKLSVYSDQAVEAVAAVPTHRVEVFWNGALYYLALQAV